MGVSPRQFSHGDGLPGLSPFSQHHKIHHGTTVDFAAHNDRLVDCQRYGNPASKLDPNSVQLLADRRLLGMVLGRSEKWAHRRGRSLADHGLPPIAVESKHHVRGLRLPRPIHVCLPGRRRGGRRGHYLLSHHTHLCVCFYVGGPICLFWVVFPMLVGIWHGGLHDGDHHHDHDTGDSQPYIYPDYDQQSLTSFVCFGNSIHYHGRGGIH